MALSQVQIIKSLGEALAWFEKELAWGVQPAQLGHLTGRIGELYAAMITRGQMALATNQHGYDVVSREGQRISVKTVTSSVHVTVRKATVHHVDRVLVLRLNVDEGEASIEELLDCSVDDLSASTRETPDGFVFTTRATNLASRPVEDMTVVAQADYASVKILQYENGTMAVERSGVREPQAKPTLREVAAEIGVSLLNGSGNPKNTRQLGSDILTVLNGQQ